MGGVYGYFLEQHNVFYTVMYMYFLLQTCDKSCKETVGQLMAYN